MVFCRVSPRCSTSRTRQVTSKRFATAPENNNGPRCALPPPPPSTVFARDSTPGVYTHATAVNNLIAGDALIELGQVGRGAISEHKVLMSAYLHALACWRARDFAGCIAALTPVAPADPPSAILLQRAKVFLEQPPSATWNAVNKLEESDCRYAAIASSRRLVTAGPNPAITMNTIAIAPAMKLNTPIVP